MALTSSVVPYLVLLSLLVSCVPKAYWLFKKIMRFRRGKHNRRDQHPGWTSSPPMPDIHRLRSCLMNNPPPPAYYSVRSMMGLLKSQLHLNDSRLIHDIFQSLRVKLRGRTLQTLPRICKAESAFAQSNTGTSIPCCPGLHKSADSRRV